MLTKTQVAQIAYLERQAQSGSVLSKYELSCADCQKKGLFFSSPIAADEFIRIHSGHRTWIKTINREEKMDPVILKETCPDCGKIIKGKSPVGTKIGLGIHRNWCPGKAPVQPVVAKREHKTYTLTEFIPTKEGDYKPQPVGDSHDTIILEKAIDEGLNILLIGETGTGKTHCLRHLASEMEMPYMRVNLNGGTTPEDLVGQWIPKKEASGFEWADGVLTKMVRFGGLFVCDEINAATAEILFILHALLDDERKVVLVQKDGEVLRAHKDFVFAATMNPTGYEGTKPLNLALFDRFDVVIDFKNNAEKFAPNDMKEIVKKIKTGIMNGDIMGAISVRGVQQYVRNRKLFGDTIAREIFVQKFEGVGRETVEHLLETIAKGY